MTVTVSSPPTAPTGSAVRQNISLTPEARRLLRELAEQTEEGNVSRLIRRLAREEAQRRKDEQG